MAQIKKVSPQSKVIVIGPEPRWLSPLPAIYRRVLMFKHRLPHARMSMHLDPDLVALNEEMRARLTHAKIDYLSPQDYLCNEAGCLSRLDDSFNSLTFMDDEHVTTAAATFLIEKMAPDILSGLGLPLQ